MGQAGKFPKTVTLERPTVGEKDGLGHSNITYADAFKCAARIWTRSSGEQSFNPAEFPVGTFRLLLRLPQAGLAVGWGLRYQGELYRIVDTEERDDDLLVTLELRQ